ncbi:MAG: TerB family tellurite resistance protein [Ramlibacter sp.]
MGISVSPVEVAWVRMTSLPPRRTAWAKIDSFPNNFLSEARLIGQAEAQARQANDFFFFTSRLNDHCSQPDKIALVEAMWDVAYASGALDAGEIHVNGKVAGLLHVTQGEYIAAKMRAKEAAGGGGGAGPA